METVCIPHQATTFFSGLNIDYLSGKENLRSFYRYRPDDKGLDEAIAERSQRPVNRAVLQEVLYRQYEGYELSPAVSGNIAALADENTFTVCTAHQPNLMTGYLYFVYKIVHAAKLAQHLQQRHPDKKFVPVFYIGSEDADLDELGVFRFNGSTFRWQTSQTGAVGRMSTKDLDPLIRQLLNLVGPPGAEAELLKETIVKAYRGQPTIAKATRYLVNAFMGHLGVVVLDADDAALKKQFAPILLQELLKPEANGLVQQTSERLNRHYSAQAYSRPINLFYLKDDLRERIEQTPDGWKVVHTAITWNREELEREVREHPERFSPNVILRGLYQESILPDVAFIGGGSEVAYWLQLMPVFDHYGVFFPAVVLRQSVQWVDAPSAALQAKAGLSDTDIFQPAEKLVLGFVHANSSHDLDLSDVQEQMNQLATLMRNKATAIDVTLKASAEAALTRMKRQVAVMEKKMLRAEKRNMADKLSRIYKVKDRLFPNGSLQERYETFLPYYLSLGEDFFHILYNATLPYGERFLLIKTDSRTTGQAGKL